MTTMQGHWHSTPAQRSRPEDMAQTLCDALTDEVQRLQPRTDANTFRLHQQFMRAHGVPRGELTTLI